MGRDSELIRLEGYIERLLGAFSNLRAEKQRLELELQELQVQKDRLEQELELVDGERTAVCDRVNSLIERLERWEMEIDGDSPSAGDDQAGEEDVGSSARGSAAEKGRKEEDATTVQKNLFGG